MRENLHPNEMAELLSVTKRTVYRYLSSGFLEEVFVRGMAWAKIPREILEDMKPDDSLLRPSDVAKILAVSRSTIYRWFWEGRLTGCLLGGNTLRLYKSGVDIFISEAEKLAGTMGGGPVEDVENPTLRKRSVPKEDSKLAAVVRLAAGMKRE